MKKLVSLVVGLAIASAVVKKVAARREDARAVTPRIGERNRDAADRDPRSAVTTSIDEASDRPAVEVGGAQAAPGSDAGD